MSLWSGKAAIGERATGVMAVSGGEASGAVGSVSLDIMSGEPAGADGAAFWSGDEMAKRAIVKVCVRALCETLAKARHWSAVSWHRSGWR